MKFVRTTLLTIAACLLIATSPAIADSENPQPPSSSSLVETIYHCEVGVRQRTIITWIDGWGEESQTVGQFGDKIRDLTPREREIMKCGPVKVDPHLATISSLRSRLQHKQSVIERQKARIERLLSNN